MANLFVSERKHNKARKWFARATALEPDLGDAWAHAFYFEVKDGTDQTRQDLVDRCVAAEPAHGELWTSVAKDPKNVRLDVAQKLRLCAEKLKRAEDEEALA